MTTIINTPGTNDNGSSGLIAGIIIAVVIIALFFLYGLPAIRQNSAPAPKDPGINIDVTIPAGDPQPANPNPAQ